MDKSIFIPQMIDFISTTTASALNHITKMNTDVSRYDL